ncbi:unnamed protein product [Rotaria magnacalcarata]
MSLHTVFVLTFILHILIAQSIASRLSSDYRYESGDDEEYGLVKRVFFRKPTPAPTQRTSSILENIIRPSSTPSSNEKPVIETQKTAYAPSYSTSDPCNLNPCENGGRCIRKGEMSYECKCVGPWRGMYCGISDACYRAPCQNEGMCINVYDGYWCKCSSDYYGTDCQNKYASSSSSENQCRPNICHTGRCVSLETKYYCDCPKDRSGDHCEKEIFKRDISKFQLYQSLLNQLKRAMAKQNMKHAHQYEDDDVAIYDVKNGIYF